MGGLKINSNDKKKKQLIASLGSAVIAANSLIATTGTAFADDKNAIADTLDELNNSSNVVLVEGGLEEVLKLEEEFMKAQEEEKAKAKAEAEAKAKAEAEKNKNFIEKVVDVFIPDEEDSEEITDNENTQAETTHEEITIEELDDVLSSNKPSSKKESKDKDSSEKDKSKDKKSKKKDTSDKKEEKENVTKDKYTSEKDESKDETSKDKDVSDKDEVTLDDIDDMLASGNESADKDSNETDDKDVSDKDEIKVEEVDDILSSGNESTDKDSNETDDEIKVEKVDDILSSVEIPSMEEVKVEEVDEILASGPPGLSIEVEVELDEIDEMLASPVEVDKSYENEEDWDESEDSDYEDSFLDIVFDGLMPKRIERKQKQENSYSEVKRGANASINGSDTSVNREVSSKKEGKEISKKADKTSEDASKNVSKDDSGKKANASESKSEYGYKVMSEEEILKAIDEACEKYDVDPALAKAQAYHESKFKQDLVSHRGAAGVMQLMPGTARGLGLTVNSKVDERFDPLKNIDAGVRYIKECERLSKYYFKVVTEELTLSFYNAGVKLVLKYKGVPEVEETQNYIRKVQETKKEFTKAA